MAHFRSLAPFALLILHPSFAEAACDETGDGVGCFDAVPMSGPAEPSPFLGLGVTRGLPARQLALKSTWLYADPAAELLAASPAPDGKRIPVVEHSLRTELRFALGLGRRFDLLGALGAAVAQSGAGRDVLASQRPEALPRAGLTDPRLGLRFALPLPTPALALLVRAESTLPLGDERAYTTSGGWSPTLAVSGSLDHGRALYAFDTGVQLRRGVRFADTRLGSEAFLRLGAAVSVWGEDTLTLGLENHLGYHLASQPEPGDDQPQVTSLASNTVLGTVSFHVPETTLFFGVSGGLGLPLSQRSADDRRIEDPFFAPNAPRALLAVEFSMFLSKPGDTGARTPFLR
jgi:hypothetical protein